MNDTQRFLLEKNLSRFDAYINAVNTKAAFLVSFNTFVLGTLLLKHDVILAPHLFSNLDEFSAFSFIACMLSIAIAIVNAFLATNPFLKEGSRGGAGRTLLFFGSISKMGRQVYADRIKDVGEGDIMEDLIEQTYILAIGASIKFTRIRTATMFTVFGTTTSIFITAVLRFIDWAAN